MPWNSELAQDARRYVDTAMAQELDDVDSSGSTVEFRRQLFLAFDERWGVKVGARLERHVASRLARITHYASGVPCRGAG